MMPQRPVVFRSPHQASRAQADRERGTAAERGYDRTWQKARLAYLREHPLCVMCEREGKVVAATIVDHEVRHRGDARLFWDRNNWQSLCKRHHDSDKQRLDRARGAAAASAHR